MDEKLHYIHGSWEKGEGNLLCSINPATSEILCHTAEASLKQALESITSAQTAFSAWSKLTLMQRYAYLERFAQELKAKEDLLAEMISKESGKPLWEAHQEVALMINKIPISLDAYKERTGWKESVQKNARLITRYRPQGVVVVLGPFNFPGHLPGGHIVPSLLAGNCVIFKPSEKTPLVAKLTVECWQKAQLPSGVLNLVQGGAEIGNALALHPQVNGIFFTGSDSTGRTLLKQLSSSPQKILALEMGGNNPLIIWDAADLRAAAYQTIISAYLTAGQRCSCARRLILPKSEYGDEFLSILTEMVHSLKVGAYTDHPEPFMGSLINQESAKKLIAEQKHLCEKGALLLAEMKFVKENSALVTPALINVTSLHDREDSELFGPFLQVIQTDTFEEAIQEANATKFGLAAALFSDRTEYYEHFYSKIRAGVVNWNMPTTGASSLAPFGGVGCSGNHRFSGFFAADYCSYPVASLEASALILPFIPLPGLIL